MTEKNKAASVVQRLQAMLGKRADRSEDRLIGDGIHAPVSIRELLDALAQAPSGVQLTGDALAQELAGIMRVVLGRRLAENEWQIVRRECATLCAVLALPAPHTCQYVDCADDFGCVGCAAPAAPSELPDSINVRARAKAELDSWLGSDWAPAAPAAGGSGDGRHFSGGNQELPSETMARIRATPPAAKSEAASQPGEMGAGVPMDDAQEKAIADAATMKWMFIDVMAAFATGNRLTERLQAAYDWCERSGMVKKYQTMSKAPAASAQHIDVTKAPGYVTPAQSSETAAAHAKLGAPKDPCDCSACVKMRGRLYGDVPSASAQQDERAAWNLIDPNGHVVATESSCVKAWARIDGYKPTVEGLLGYEQHGWRVVQARSAQQVQADVAENCPNYPCCPCESKADCMEKKS